MIWLQFGMKQMKRGKSMEVLDSFTWNYVEYANMEGFCRDSHISYVWLSLLQDIRHGCF